MTAASPNSYPEMKPADLPKDHWVPLHFAPFFLASDRDFSDEDLTAYRPGEVLEIAGVVSKVSWGAGQLRLWVPCKRGKGEFMEGGRVGAMVSSGAEVAPYWAAAATAALLRAKTVIVETQPEHELAWLQFARRHLRTSRS